MSNLGHVSLHKTEITKANRQIMMMNNKENNENRIEMNVVVGSISRVHVRLSICPLYI